MKGLSDYFSIIHIDTDNTNIADSNILAFTVLIAKLQPEQTQPDSISSVCQEYSNDIFDVVNCSGIHSILFYGNHNVQIQHLETYYVKNKDISSMPLTFPLNEISDEYRNEHGQDINTVLDVVHSLIENTYVFIFNDKLTKQLISKYDSKFFLRDDGSVIATHDIQIYETESHISAMQRVLYHYGEKEFKFIAKGIETLKTLSKRSAYIKFLLTLHDKIHLSIRWYLTECEPYVPVIVSGKYKYKRIDEVVETDSNWIKNFIHSKERLNENYIREYVYHHYIQ